MLINLTGGIGLFLVGMHLLTDGLQKAGGTSMKQIMSTMVSNRVRGILAGALLTTAVQSSSAITVLTIGLTSAGILSLQSTIAIVLGANIGSTTTAWLVAIAGLKFSLSSLALPMIAAGSVALILSRQRYQAFGFISAGLGLVFLGIDFMQLAMEDAASQFRPENLPGTDLYGRLLLAAIGTIMTVLMQSSGAAMAITLTALASGSIRFDQAAALAIGQNIGTTITAALAAAGGTVSARRTATAHILFNLITAFMVLIGFTLFVEFISKFNDYFRLHDSMVQLAVFHTAFNSFGVLLFVPFISSYAKIVKRLIKGKQEKLTEALDENLLSVPDAAIAAAGSSALKITESIYTTLSDYLSGKFTANHPTNQLKNANTELASYISNIRVEKPERQASISHLVHCIDHFESLFTILEETEKARYVLQHKSIEEAVAHSRSIIESVLAWCQYRTTVNMQQFEKHSKDMANQRKSVRKRIIETTTRAGKDAEEAMLGIEAIRWLDRIAYHTWRLTGHLSVVTELHNKVNNESAENEIQNTDS